MHRGYFPYLLRCRSADNFHVFDPRVLGEGPPNVDVPSQIWRVHFLTCDKGWLTGVRRLPCEHAGSDRDSG